MSNKTDLQSNNNDLQGILNIINGLPAANTNELPTLSQPATVDKVLSGYDYIDGDGNQKVGTMTNRGAVSQSLAINGTYTIPEGYHNGGGKITQTVTTKVATTYGAKTSDQTIAAGQYLSGAQIIKKVEQTNLTAANIVKGKTITIKSNGSNLWSITGTAETNYDNEKYYLIKNGSFLSQVYPGGWSQQSGYVQISFPSGSMSYKDLGTMVDLTNFSTITIEISAISISESRTRTFYIMDCATETNVANKGCSGANIAATVTIDVSSLSGFHMIRGRSQYESMRITNLYLS